VPWIYHTKQNCTIIWWKNWRLRWLYKNNGLYFGTYIINNVCKPDVSLQASSVWDGHDAVWLRRSHCTPSRSCWGTSWMCGFPLGTLPCATRPQRQVSAISECKDPSFSIEYGALKVVYNPKDRLVPSQIARTLLSLLNMEHCKWHIIPKTGECHLRMQGPFFLYWIWSTESGT
jgi:hypothetical protein